MSQFQKNLTIKSSADKNLSASKNGLRENFFLLDMAFLLGIVASKIGSAKLQPLFHKC
jgi:hypothetical protein